LKWLGQHIVSLIARFKSSVYLEGLTTTTETNVLVVDSTGLVSKSTSVGGDITGVTAGTGLSGGGTTGDVTLDILSEQALTGIVLDGNKSVTPGDGAMFHVDSSDITDNNTSTSGTAAMYAHVNIEHPRLLATNSSVTTTDAATLYISNAPVASTNQTITRAHALWVAEGKASFGGDVRVDGTLTGNVTGNLTGDASGSSGSCTGQAATVATIAGLAPNTATTQATQGNITSCANLATVGTIGTGVWQGTAIGSSYVSTLNQDTTGNAATVTLGSGTADANMGVVFSNDSGADSSLLTDGGVLYNPSSNLLTVGNLTVTGTTIGIAQRMHYEFKGYSSGDGTNYEIPKTIQTNLAPFNHDINVGSSPALSIQEIARTGGVIMPRACTLKRWTGWATANGSSADQFIALFKITPVRDQLGDTSADELEEVQFTALGNNKLESWDVDSSFTETAIAAGDLLITGVKCPSGVTVYFNSTVEVEF
jgi:hypothetical protein